MAGKHRTTRGKRPSAKAAVSAARGFDFAERRQVVALADMSFNDALLRAGVMGCSYQFENVDGIPGHIPSIRLVAQNEAPLREAFDAFSNWGCQEDGDAVDVTVLLRNHGGYELWIGPETARTLYRTIPQSDLFSPSIYNVSWIHRLDTTNPFLHELKDYCRSRLSPVLISGCIADRRTAMLLGAHKDLSGLPRLVKFNLEVLTEDEQAEHQFFGARRRSGRGLPPKPERPLKARDYPRDRRRVLDVAFPVTRERIRRLGLADQVRADPLFSRVGEAQVIQAAVNLILSHELNSGDHHYSKVEGNLADVLWEHISDRAETVELPVSPAVSDLAALKRQITLDVDHVLVRHGIPPVNLRFPKRQALYRRKGFVDD